MIRLTDAELAGLEPVIEARKSAPDISDKKQENGILTDNITSTIIPLGDLGIAARGGEGLSIDALLQMREAALK